jgi:hypothetical protein
MTAQAYEKLIYRNEEHKIATEPLEKYLSSNDKPKFSYKSTDCWRGYVGTWEIKSNKLYLIDLVGFTENEDVGMDYLFKNQTKVFADWYSGELKVPQGEMIKYSHRGHFSIYEKDIIFNFNQGNLIDQKIVDNRTNKIEIVNFQELHISDLKDKINNSTLYELIEMYNTELKSVTKEKYAEYRANKFDENSKLYAKLNISQWTASEKENLFIGTLRGINHFYFIITNKTKLPIDGFNSVMNAINGENYIYVNLKSIKWFPSEIKSKIKAQNIIFEELEPIVKKNNRMSSRDNGYYDDRNWLEDASGTNDPETMNDVFWNLD